jgi:DNA-binding NarL/FixJ family response regulator
MQRAQTATAAITVAIIEDDAAVRHSLAGILAMERGIECVGAYGTAEEAIREVCAARPDVMLVDINLPGMDGVEFVRRMSAAAPETKLIMLTVHDDSDAIFHSLEAGASGYLLKPARAAEMIAAVRDVQAGGAPMTGNIARKVVQSFRQAPKLPIPGQEDLSPREMEVLNYLAKGYLYKEVADKLNIGYATVHTHVARIYEKLQVRSRSQAVAKYHKL